MEKQKKFLDDYFNEARQQDAGFSMDDARNLLESGNAASENSELTPKRRITKMQFIISAITIAAAVGIISFNPFTGGQATGDAETTASTERTISIIPETNEETHNPVQYASNNDEKPTEKRQTIQIIPGKLNNDEARKAPDNKEDKSPVSAEKDKEFNWTAKDNSLEVKGVKTVKLSPENLEKLGLTIGNNSEGMKYISYWNTRMKEPIEFKVLVDWGIEMNPNEKMPNEMKNKTMLSPKMITDNSGNRRVEVYEFDDEVLTESRSPTEVVETVDGNQKNTMLKQEKQLFMQKKENDVDHETITYGGSSGTAASNENILNYSELSEDLKEKIKNSIESGTLDVTNSESLIKILKEIQNENNGNMIFMNDDSTGIQDFNIQIRMTIADNENSNKDILLKRLAQQNENSISFLDGFEKFDEKQMKSFFLEMDSALENVSKYIFTDKTRLDSLVNSGHFEGMELMLISSARLPIDTTSESIDSVLNLDMNKLAASYFNDVQNKFKIGGLPFGEIIQNSIVHHFKYIDVNQLIPIEVPVPGAKNKQGKELEDFSFIVWYEPTPELLELLPEDVAAQIEPELIALANAMGDGEEPEICEAAPVTGDDNYFDIWRSCSGNIRNLKVYPNPSSGPVNVEFELKEETELFISVHTLNGRKIEELKRLHSYPAGKVSESFALGSGFEPGLYLVVIQASNGDQAVQRLILK